MTFGYLVQALAQLVGESTHRAHNVKGLLRGAAIVFVNGFFANLSKLHTAIGITFNTLLTIGKNNEINFRSPHLIQEIYKQQITTAKLKW